MTIPSTAETTGAGTVAVDVSDGIATIRFAHPKGNSLPGTLLRRLAAEIDAIGLDERARVVVLRSEGLGPFCAGASFEELVSIDDQATGHEFFMGFARLILSMKRCPKLIVARVHGKAVGGGVGVAAAADYSLASSFASIKLSELAVGIGPFVVGPAIERRIGTSAFSALALDADWRDAAWCERHGLYTRICDNTPALDQVLGTLAHKLATFNPDAISQLKAALWENTPSWDALLEERAAMSGTLVLSEFTRSALAAFEKK